MRLCVVSQFCIDGSMIRVCGYCLITEEMIATMQVRAYLFAILLEMTRHGLTHDCSDHFTGFRSTSTIEN